MAARQIHLSRMSPGTKSVTGTPKAHQMSIDPLMTRCPSRAVCFWASPLLSRTLGPRTPEPENEVDSWEVDPVPSKESGVGIVGGGGRLDGLVVSIPGVFGSDATSVSGVTSLVALGVGGAGSVDVVGSRGGGVEGFGGRTDSREPPVVRAVTRVGASASRVSST